MRGRRHRSTILTATTAGIALAVAGLATPVSALKCDIKGSPGPDNLKGTAKGETICGFGDDGDDGVRGGDGEDREYGGAGKDDFATSDANFDIVRGGSGIDTIFSRDLIDDLKSIEIFD